MGFLPSAGIAAGELGWDVPVDLGRASVDETAASIAINDRHALPKHR